MLVAQELVLQASKALLDPHEAEAAHGSRRLTDSVLKRLSSSSNNTNGSHELSIVRVSSLAPVRSGSGDKGCHKATAESRFHFFQTMVAPLHIWKEYNKELFHQLKSIVQDHMDELRLKCDAVYAELSAEPSGAELSSFSWPSEQDQLQDPPEGPDAKGRTILLLGRNPHTLSSPLNAPPKPATPSHIRERCVRT